MNDPFQSAAINEFQKSAAQLALNKDTGLALTKSYGRYDNLIASAVEQSSIKPACQPGCAFCCHYKVEVRAPEMLLVNDYLRATFSAERLTQTLARAQANETVIRALTPEEHLTTNLQCPLLEDNQCSVYPVRPFRCRNFHSTDANACERSHNDPDDMELATGMIEDVALLADAQTQGFEAAAEQTGRDHRIYDFTTALVEVLTDADATKRYQRGKRTFKQAIQVLP
jgi:Fe-S-cluster containining protein